MFDTPRSFRLAAAAATSILVLTTACANDTSGPHAPLAGKLAIAPDFGVLQTDIVDIARGRFVLTRIPSGAVAADTVIDIPPDADSVSLGILVPVLTPGETFNLLIRLVDTGGDTVFSGGPVEVSPTTSGAPVPVDIPFDYVGTGADAAGVRILSADTSSFTGESILLTAVAFDSNEAPIPGTPIGWESLDTARVRITTDAQDRGIAVGGNQRGVARIVAALVTGQMDTVLIANQPLPTAIVAESGSGQSARADSTLTSPLVARVTAADGLGVRGLWVRFAVTSGGGVISSDSVLTDAAGQASATWTLARSFQPHVVTATTARLAASSAVFNATLVFEPAAALEIVAGDGQTAAAGTPVSIAPRVRVLDAAGLPVPGVTVTFSVTSGAGVVAGGTPVTDTLGLAAVASWTLGDVPGRNALQAAVGPLTATFTATGVVGPAARLAFTVEPSTVARDAIIAPPVVVTAYDAVGNLAAGFGGDVQVALLANPGGATLSGSAMRSATAGVATFDDLALGAAGTGYTLLATAAGLTPDTSAAFDVLTGATSWDAAADFSITANPNGRWSSGWTATLGSTFNLYPSASTGGNVVGWFDPAIVNLGTPSFAKNVSGVTQNGVAPGQVTLHPGCNAQEYSELRWTAPGGGTYLANARFLAGDLGNTNAAVLVNGGTPVFTAASTGGNPSYSSFLTLAPGDRLQFTVGTGGDGCTYDNTPIVVTVLATSAVTLTANSATTQTAPTGTPVSAPPSVIVRDGDNNPVAGVSVSFQVTAGGGSLTGATQVTDQSGIATVGSWTLDLTPGTNAVTASVPGVSAVTFTATGVAGANNWLGGSGVWSNASQWSLGRIPIPGDTVLITAGGDYTVTMDVSATVAKLRLGGATDIIVLDASSQGLTITDPGPGSGLQILPFGFLLMSESGLLADRITNEGTIRAGGSLIQSSAFTNLGTLNVQWGEVVLSHPTSYDLQTSGTVLVEDSATLTLSANGGLTYLGGTITGGAASTGVIRLLPNVPLVLGANLTYNNLIVESIDGSVMPQAAQQLTVGQFAQFRAVGTGVTEILAPVAVDGIVDIRNGTLELGATAALNATGILRGVGVLDATATTGTGALVGSISPGDQPSALPGILTWVGDFAPDPGAVLNIDLGGPGAGSQHDRFDVQGATELDGTLRVTLRDGFVPSAGDRFPVMTFSAALYGFATLAFPTVAGLVFDTTTVIDPTSADTLYVVVQSAPPQLIAFAGDSSGGLSTGVFRVYGDGTGLGRLVSTTFTGTNYFYPRWAPDRSRVGFAVTSAVAGIDLLTVVSADGAETATVVSDLTTRLPRWSPDGVHLAYACGEGSSVPFNQWHVCVITDATGSVSSLAGRGNGSGKVMVSWFDPVYRLNGVPAFAWNPTNPDQIAFVRDSAGAVNSSRIYVSTYTAGSWVRTELSPEVMDLGAGPLTIEGNWLDFSPDGQRIIFTATAPQDPVAHIYAINVNGTGLTQLSSGTGWDYDAWFSPDGSEILYNRDLSCSLDAWVMNGDGSNQHQVTAESVCDFQTWLLGNDWSPDGQAIVLTGFDTSGNLLIYKVPRTTTAQTYLVDRVLVGRGVDAGGFVRDIQPSWRP